MCHLKQLVISITPCVHTLYTHSWCTYIYVYYNRVYQEHSINAFLNGRLPLGVKGIETIRRNPCLVGYFIELSKHEPVKHCHKKPYYFNFVVLTHQSCYLCIYSNYLFKLSNFGASFLLITVRHKPIRLHKNSRGIYWKAWYKLVLLMLHEIFIVKPWTCFEH